MRDIIIAITAASYSGNKGAAAMLQSSIKQLYDVYGDRLNVNLMSVYPCEDKKQIPYDFINVVDCKPEKLMFVAFPLAIIYKCFKWLLPLRKILENNKIIKTYINTDLVLDEAGISFVDSRGFVMNTYAFVCAAVPLLLGKPVVKYSQAMGTFDSMTNKLLAKIILPKISLICARGEDTYKNLEELGIKENVKLCADGAFTMEDSEYWNKKVNNIVKNDMFYNNNVISISISSVVEKRCNKMKIDYKNIMVEFINYLNENNFNVLIIANAARINSQKPRNNDLMIGDAIYDEVKYKNQVRWYHEEMAAEEIRAFISKTRVLIGSRFHSMVGALQKEVPVLLIGWSHKYKEVLDMFELGEYAIDYSKLSYEELLVTFNEFMTHETEIKNSIKENYDKVMQSSRDNIIYTTKVIEEVISKNVKRDLHEYSNPEKYMGKYLSCRKGYASDEKVRENAASGGVVTALLCHLIDKGTIDGACVTKSIIKDGVPGYEIYIAKTKEDICNASSSVYMDIPLMRYVDEIGKFEGKIAVVLTPCMMRALTKYMERDSELSKKVVLKLGLYCSGNHEKEATSLSIKKAGLDLENAKRLYYRRGHWRGVSTILYSDGTEKNFSYTKTICAYKNAYFFEKGKCMLCQDHFARYSDISFGDIWLKSMKKESVKYTSCIIRSEVGYEMYKNAVDAGEIIDYHMSSKDIVKSQKRALTFKYNCAEAKKNYYEKLGRKVQLNLTDKCKWNHKLAFYLARKNCDYSISNYEKLKNIPMFVVYYYMCFIRLLLSF